MPTVGIEAGGYAGLCMWCPPERWEPHAELYVILWEWGMPQTPSHGGGCLRLCWEHADELSRLLLEVL